jgi:nickel transport protein
MKKFILVFFFSLFVLNNSVSAHSIHVEVTKHAPFVSVNTYYSKISPATNVSVSIFAPGENQPYQTGKTDRQGYFVFAPSVAGDWVFEIDDETGHKNKISIAIGDDFIDGGTGVEAPLEENAEESSATPVREKGDISIAKIPFIYKLLFGLALIFGLTGIYYGARSRQSLKKG